MIGWLLFYSFQATKKVPKLCDKLRAVIEPLRKADVPVISWNDYRQQVKAKYEGMDEETLRTVTSYFHLLGEVGDLNLISLHFPFVGHFQDITKM